MIFRQPFLMNMKNVWLGFVIILIASSCNRTIHYRENASDELTTEEMQTLNAGDVILRQGFGVISEAIATFSKDKYPVSHCGLIVQNQDGSFSVIHTVSNALSETDGMQKDSLSVFVRDAKKNTIIILRHHLLKNDDVLVEKLTQQAELYLQRQIPFDNQFDFDDTTAFFCTEMIWHLFDNALHTNIFSVGKKQYHSMQFSAFFDTNTFVPIVNHFENNSLDENRRDSTAIQRK